MDEPEHEEGFEVSYSSDEEEDLEEEEIYYSLEDLFHKNSPSFKCLQQIEISRSSLLRDPLYWFPELQDPNLDDALWGEEESPIYDDIGVERYRDLCKQEGIIPYRRVIRSLDQEVLDLKYYALSVNAMKTICETLQFNNYVKELILQENWFKPEAVAHLAPLLEINKTITVLDLKQCQIGNFGAEQLGYSIGLTKTLIELDLSHNNLGDEGIELLSESLRDNTSIKILNLSHNNLGDRALIALRPVLEDNYMIKELDLSWNYFYNPAGMKELMEALAENIALTHLNLAWNGIGDKDTIRFIQLYFKSDNTKLQHLDLSHNRITGIPVRMLRNGLKSCESLITLNMGYNPLTVTEVQYLSGTFFDKRENPLVLSYIDFGNTWVNKTFVQVLNRIHKKDADVRIGGIFSNYTILGPNVKEVLLERAKLVALKPKNKKKKKDIGEFLIMLKEDPVTKEEFFAMIKKQKIKLDKDLIEMMATTFADKKRVNLKDMRDVYLNMYPDTVPPPPKQKKGKGKKKKKKTE